MENYVIQQKFRPMSIKSYAGFYISKLQLGLKDMIVLLI